MDSSFKIDPQALIKISNQANKKFCVPLARKVMSRLPKHVGGRIEVEDRKSETDWARTKIVTNNVYREKNAGYLTKALGQI